MSSPDDYDGRYSFFTGGDAVQRWFSDVAVDLRSLADVIERISGYDDDATRTRRYADISVDLAADTCGTLPLLVDHLYRLRDALYRDAPLIVVTVNCRTDSFGHTFHTIDLAFDEELSVGYVSRVLAELAARLLDTTDTIPPGHTAFCHAPAAHTRESEKEPG